MLSRSWYVCLTLGTHVIEILIENSKITPYRKKTKFGIIKDVSKDGKGGKMIFSVKYKKKDGSLDFIEVEAESRAAVSSILEQRGIAAIEVDDACGWNRSKSSLKPSAGGHGKSSMAFKCFLVGLLLVALGVVGLLWFCTSPSTEKSEIEKSPVKIKEVTPANVKREEPRVQKERVKPKSVEDAMANLEEQPKTEIVKRTISPEEWDRLTNRTFKTGTEQLMSWVFTTELGDMPMPIPPIGEEEKRDIAAILISENPINEEKDDEMTKVCKEQVQLAKKEMAKYVGEGGDPDEFLQYYFKELKRAFEFRNDAIQQCEELAEEDPAMASEFVKRINEKFAEEGIKAIPDTYSEKDEIEE